ncbi:MAG: UDP-glucose 4-epimerase GalE [Persicimonas sp.]
MNILITGGAGYIGSHVVYECLEAGHDVVVLDDLSTGVRDNLPVGDIHFVFGDVGDRELVLRVLHQEAVDAVMHFAASSVVPESVERPLKYYGNNTAGSCALIDACVEAGVEHFIFSSTAAVYGVLDEVPVTEEHPTAPTNPYGHSKVMIEQMLADVSAVTPLSFAALRYFNVAGADPKGRTGESIPESTHLIKVASEVALGERPYIEIYGTDYPTPDGTCVRDYIHVSDLARAHLLALDELAEHGEDRVLNCGYGRGFSVREVIETVQRVSDNDFEIREADRRAGDPPELVADSSKLRELYNWQPRYDDLEFIVSTALEWEEYLLS